jgi:hypothetical protein
MSVTDRLLAQLDPHWERIARRPLSRHALEQLESTVGQSLPVCLVDFLRTVGLFQDLTNVESNAVLVFESIPEYAAARQDLLDGLYGEVDMKLLPFGHNGAGDLFALRETAKHDADIYFLSQTHASAEPSGTTFNQWLQSIVDETRASIERRVLIRNKQWHVQFAFRGADFDAILDAMRQVGAVRVISGDWQFVEESTTGVKKSTAQMQFDDQILQIKRLEYPHWVSPWYFIDMNEPLEMTGKGSAIQQLDDLFYARVPGYGLINYGALLKSNGNH